MPAFEKLQENFNIENVEVLLVSMDFPDKIESKLLPFIKEKKLQSKVVLLDDPDQNTWIPKISKQWSGALPATLIYSKNKRKFYEQSFNYEELKNEVQTFLN